MHFTMQTRTSHTNRNRNSDLFIQLLSLTKQNMMQYREFTVLPATWPWSICLSDRSQIWHTMNMAGFGLFVAGPLQHFQLYIAQRCATVLCLFKNPWHLLGCEPSGNLQAWEVKPRQKCLKPALFLIVSISSSFQSGQSFSNAYPCHCVHFLELWPSHSLFSVMKVNYFYADWHLFAPATT